MPSLACIHTHTRLASLLTVHLIYSIVYSAWVERAVVMSTWFKFCFFLPLPELLSRFSLYSEVAQNIVMIGESIMTVKQIGSCKLA